VGAAAAAGLEPIAADRAKTAANENQRVWTDDYSNVLGAVWRRLRDGEE